MDFVSKVRDTYPWLDIKDATRIVNFAKMSYYNYKYPSDTDIDEEACPIRGFRNETWILAACDELVERLGFSSALGYRENGMSWTFDNTHLSKFLISQLFPATGVIGD